MASIPVHVILHGLIALSPDNPTGTKELYALLVNAATPPAMECMASHTPILDITASDDGTCKAASCTPNDQNARTGNCRCQGAALAGKEITLVFTPPQVPPGVTLAQKPPRNPFLPSDKVEAGNFYNVLNVSQPPFNLPLDPQYTGKTPDPSHLAARMRVPFDSLIVCSLIKREDGATTNIHAVGSRRLGDQGAAGEITQSAAQNLVASLSLQNPLQVVLHIHDFNAQNDHAIPLSADAHGFTIELSNEPPALARDAPCDDGIARHFDLFYLLAAGSPSPHLIPHVRLTQYTEAKDSLRPDDCQLFFMQADRPVCPMATFGP